ncbi:MAG: group II intron reverse transcriptase/maturase [Leptospiraceae bacterium]|nr:group II intron reverse transcriptase/maturase [Leptospiraceae bacterium]
MLEQLEFDFTSRLTEEEQMKSVSSEGVIEQNNTKSERDLANSNEEADIYDDLMKYILAESNISFAIFKVKKNKGAAGIDGVTVDELDKYVSENLPRIKQEIMEGRYKPKPVRRVEIPKPNGGIRLLGIPTVMDRVIQQAMFQQLNQIYDREFSNSSFGFRPFRSAHNAVRQAKKYIMEGYKIVVDIDLEKFFDTVNHDMLMSKIYAKIKDKALLKLIRSYLQSGIMINGVCVRSEEGVPQGSPLSPLLSNIILDELDKELEKRGHKFCRYADDCNIYVKGRRSGERVMESITKFIEKKLKLKVNKEKSASDFPSKRKFLGFSFIGKDEKVKIRISTKSIDTMKDNIRKLTQSNRSISLEKRIGILNSYLRGWIGYYALTEAPSILNQLMSWLRRRLRLCIWHTWKRPRTKIENLMKLGVSRYSAFRVGRSNKKEWRMSKNSVIHEALSNDFFVAQGLVNILYLRNSIRENW